MRLRKVEKRDDDSDDSDDSDDEVVVGPSSDTKGTPYNYMAIIDAGSTGSRIHIFKWLSDSGKLEIKQEPSWYKKVDGGIDKYAEKPQKVGKKHLKKLLKHAARAIPGDQLRRTPIFLHATGGMRNLGKQDQLRIIDNVCSYISEKSNFWLPDCKSHVRVIQGGEEGLYGWIAANYLIGAFDDPKSHNHGKDHATYGILDMGGASLEVAFEPVKGSEEGGAPSDITSYSLNLKQEYDIHTQSFQGYGLKMAHVAYLQVIAAESAQEGDKDVKLQDPCAPKGYRKDLKLPGGSKIETVGSGNAVKCDKYLKVLAKDQCRVSKRDMDGAEPPRGCLLKNSPLSNMDIHHFIGVSKYHDVITSPVWGLKDTSKFDHDAFNLAVNDFCGQEWEAIVKQHSYINQKQLSSLCFRAKWLNAVLDEGFGFVGGKEKQVDDNRSRRKRPTRPPSSNVQFVKGSSDKNSTSLFKKDSITFLDPFQSADIIRGQQYSWALGKAVLYASAENQDLNTVGYEYNHESSSDKVKINGAEQKKEWIRPQYKRGESSNWHEIIDSHGGDRVWGSIAFLFILVIVAYLLLGKTRRDLILQSMSSRLWKRRQGPVRGAARQPYQPIDDIELGDVETEFEVHSDDEVDVENRK